MSTKLVRTYNITSGKTIYGIGKAVENFFHTYKGTKVTLNYESNGACVVSCVTDSVWSAPGLDKKLKGAVRKFSGNDVKIKVSIVPKGRQAEVHYFQNISETIRTAKAVFKSFAFIGASELYGINERLKIPGKLDAVIKNYLNT